MERVGRAFAMGVSAFRVNFARHSIEANVDLLGALREWSDGRRPATERFVDLPGPKPRLGEFVRGSESLQTGDAFTLLRDTTRLGDASAAGVSLGPLFRELAPGDVVKLADGTVHLRVEERGEGAVRCRVVRGGRVYSRCGAAVPARYRPNGALTRRDRSVLRVAAPHATHICVSFADTPGIVEETRSAARPGTRILAKVESPVAIEALAGLARAADGLVLARGDLSVFYSSDDIRALGIRLDGWAARSGGISIFATDFFRGIVTAGKLDRAEVDQLSWAFGMRPHYLLINETSYSARWREVLAAAVRFQRASQAGRLSSRDATTWAGR